MRLKHYWTSGGTVEFDPVTGDVRLGKGEKTEPDCFGSVWKQRGRWFALWYDGNSLVFQHRRNRWKLTPDVSLQVAGRYRRTFQIIQSGVVEFHFSYWFKGMIASHFDPTYDQLEEESDDFFLYVTTMWEYWKDRHPDEIATLAKEAGFEPH